MLPKADTSGRKIVMNWELGEFFLESFFRGGKSLFLREWIEMRFSKWFDSFLPCVVWNHHTQSSFWINLHILLVLNGRNDVIRCLCKRKYVKWNDATIVADKKTMHCSPETSNVASFYFGYISHKSDVVLKLLRLRAMTSGRAAAYLDRKPLRPRGW